MNNRVIYRSARGALEAGLATLRFNFRGVGASSGTYSRGAGEKKDVAALLDWLHRKYPELPISLIGFSFGAWVGLQVGCHDSRIRALVGLGLPLNLYDFEFLLDIETPMLFVIGTRDPFCPRHKMEALLRRLPPSSSVQWIEGADHLFTGQVDTVQKLIRDFLSDRLKGHFL